MEYALTIIILNYNGSEDTIACIESLDKLKTQFKYQIVILDNASIEENYLNLEKYCESRGDFFTYNKSEMNLHHEGNKYLIRSDINYGFAKGNNEMIKVFMDSSEYFLLLNNDTVVEPDFVEKMMLMLKENRHIKYASCRIHNFFQKDVLWSCGGTLTPWGNRHGFSEKELMRRGNIIMTPYITGCALFLERELLKKHGLLTEDFFFGEEDFNFCWRMHKAGVKGACLNKILVYHKVNQSSKKSGTQIGKLAGYYVARIIDMKNFYPTFVWYLWKAGMLGFIRVKCYRMGMEKNEIKQIIKLTKKYSFRNKLTQEDCLSMRNL